MNISANIIDWIHEHIKCQLFDYTKVFTKKSDNVYHLTYSLSERNRAACLQKLKSGHNIAAIFNLRHKHEFPRRFLGYPIINGDLHDLRFLDKTPAVVGLSAKGQGKRDSGGFVVCAGDHDVSKRDNKLLAEANTSLVDRVKKKKEILSKQSFSERQINRQMDRFIEAGKPLLMLPESNPKFQKSIRYGYLIYGLALSPARENGFVNFCPGATKGCITSCLHTAGGIHYLRSKVNSRLVKSWLFINRREWFIEKLQRELLLAYCHCVRRNMKMALRLNVTSDIDWRKIECK